MSTLILLFAGCLIPDPDNGGQSGEEKVGCTPVTTTAYGLADVTPLGFSGQEVYDFVVGEDILPFTWSDGASTDLTLTVSSSATEVLWRDMEWQDDGSGMELAMDCADDVVLASTVGFVTADGAFDESWDLDVAAVAVDAATAFVEPDLDALGGTYEVTEVDPADYDAVRIFVDLTFGATGPSGSVTGQAETVGDTADPDSTASATAFDVGTF